MIVKTEEDPLKEADIMVENFVDHVIMGVWDNKEHFVPLLFQIQSVFKALPWKQVIDCQFSEQTPGPPFSPPAAHKIVNCLGKQAMGNLGVKRHKSQRENYGTPLCYVHGQMGST